MYLLIADVDCTGTRLVNHETVIQLIFWGLGTADKYCLSCSFVHIVKGPKTN